MATVIRAIATISLVLEMITPFATGTASLLPSIAGGHAVQRTHLATSSAGTLAVLESDAGFLGQMGMATQPSRATRPLISPPPAAYTITDLGTGTTAAGINDEGQVVGDDAHGAFIWSPEHGLTTIAPGSIDDTLGINDRGQVAGGTKPAGSTGGRAYLWSVAGGREDLGVLGGGTWSIGTAVNNSSTVVGFADDPSSHHMRAFEWTARTGLVDLSPSDRSEYSRAYGINSGGQVIGDIGTTYGVQSHAVLWNVAHQITDLGALPGKEQSFAGGINDAGDVVGTAWHGSFVSEQAFLWHPTTGIHALSPLPGDTMSEAGAINDSGDIVGDSGRAHDRAQEHAALWHAGGPPLDLNALIPLHSGWILQQALDINAYGQITGNGELGGKRHAFLLTPLPTPGPERVDCQTPDILAQAAAIPLHVARLPYRYSGVVATFCDNDTRAAASDYTVSVVWTASYYPGTKAHPGSSFYGPSSESDIDFHPRITGSRGEFTVRSSFLIQSLGHINIAVVIHKIVGSRGFAAVSSRAYINAPRNLHDERLGEAVGREWSLASQAGNPEKDPKSMLIAHRYDPWFTVGFYNQVLFHNSIPTFPNAGLSFFDLIGTANSQVLSQGDINNLARSVVSALTSGDAHSDLCDSLLFKLVDQQPPAPSNTMLAESATFASFIASNASASDALLDCASRSKLRDYATRTGTGREPFLWHIAVTYFLDHLDEYAACDLSQSFDNQTNGLCDTKLTPQQKKDRLDLLKVIVDLATGTGTKSAPVYSNILERGIGLWVTTHLPHPIVFCNPSCTRNPITKTEGYWAAGTGKIYGAINVGVQDHITEKDAQKTVDLNLRWGVAFWALGVIVAAPWLWTGVPEVAAWLISGAVGLGTTYAAATLIPPVDPSSDLHKSTEARLLGAASNLAALLIESRSLWDSLRNELVIPDYRESFGKQIGDVVKDWISRGGNCSDARYRLVNQRLEETSYTACENVFNSMGFGAFLTSS